uniref:Thioredoxin n=1 Tax=Candidatus Kentrum sp. MB TaxID=2138164 RepID=A0A451B892_9GAMM|nr:MAG: thioredoxin [Candidatus Kentron sp. MB]VFK27998.1 MAG: thioredoxin [Candidatus Kentron sp. MB]VFK74510.1 MAG: thioredoxin [Candidatus Kentron sp. MB]
MDTSAFVFDVNEQDFSEVVIKNSHRVPVLVDFWAIWCAPCKMLAPVLIRLAEEFNGSFILAKINTDEQQQLAAQYHIRSIPTVKVFRDGIVVDEFTGAQSEGAIREILDRHVERESDRTRAEAMAMHEGGNTEKAIQLLRDTLASDLTNDRVSLDLAQLLMDKGRFTEAEEVLRVLPDKRQMDSDIIALRIRLKFSRIADDAQTATVLEDRIAKDPGDCEARYRLGAQKAIEGDYEAAMGHFLDIMRKDRVFLDDAGRKALVDVFTLIGETSPLVSRYRSLMSSMLY